MFQVLTFIVNSNNETHRHIRIHFFYDYAVFYACFLPFIRKHFLYILSHAGLTDDEKLDLSEKTKDVVKNKVYPALKAVRDFIKDTYLPQTRTGYGVGTLDKGQEYYRQCLR